MRPVVGDVGMGPLHSAPESRAITCALVASTGWDRSARGSADATNATHFKGLHMSFFEWLDNASLVAWIRDSPSVFAYPTIIAFHTFSLALLVGMSCGLALRALGAAATVPLAPLDKYFRFIWLGFAISAASGIPLMATDALNFLNNPVFYVKMGAIFAAVFTVRLMRRAVYSAAASPERNVVSAHGKVLSWCVLALWMVALTAGRVTAYDRFIAWETAGAVIVVLAISLVAGLVGARVVRGSSSAQVQHRPGSTTVY